MIAIVLFTLMYVVMIAKTEWRLYAIWTVAVLFVLFGILKRNPLYWFSVINWNVIMMIGGTMVIVYYFIESKMPNRLAELILDKCSTVKWVIILMSLFAGAVSAFIDNVATVLMIAPVGLAICKKVTAEEKTEVEGIFPTIALCAVVVCLIIASFIPNTPSTINGIICCVIAVICMLADLQMKKMPENIKKSVLSIDFETLCILLGLFLVIQGITDVGVIDLVANGIAKVGGKNLFLLYTIIVWGSVLFSAFVDNIPYVATMLPIITGISQLLGIEPYLLYFGLLSGATLGGNITPIGASANITAVGMLKQNGYTVKFSDFMKIGIPFTFVAVLTGYLFIWFFWH